MKKFSISCAVLALSLMALLGAPLASAKPAPVEHYARLPHVYDAALSPDGKFLAAIINNDGEYIVRVVNLTNFEDTTPRVALLDKGVKINWVRWASNDQFLISTSQIRKYRQTSYDTGYLFVADKNVTSLDVVLRPEIYGNKGRSVVGMRQFNNRIVDFLPDDPFHILMEFDKDNPRSLSVHKVNIGTQKSVRVKRGTSSDQDWTTDANHQLRLRKGRKDRSGDYSLRIRDIDSDKWRNTSEYPGLTAETDTYGFTNNPSELIIGQRNGKDTMGLYVYDLQKKRRTRTLFHHDKYDAIGVIRSADGKRIVGTRYLADSEMKVFTDPVYKARMDKLQARLPNYLIRSIDQTPDGRLALFKVSAPDTAPILFMYNFVTDKLTKIQEDYPELSGIAQGDVTSITYTARDGFEIPGYVTTPSKIGRGEIALKNLPFVIMPHGGPYARDTKEFDYMAQFMASRGYAVLQMNFRGSQGYGKSFEDAGRKNWVIMQEDVEDGARWLIKKGYADPQRICIVGWSYGGYASLMGAIKNPALYACSVSIAGVTDLKDMINDLKKYRFGQHLAKSFVLRGFEDRHDIKANSPVKRATEYTVPLLLIHGKKDTVVQYDQFTRMKKALKRSKAKVTYLALKEGDHSLTGYQDRLAMFKALDIFLLKHLGKSEAAP